MKCRDKRGLEIQVGDTLIGGADAEELEFIEVDEITEAHFRCSPDSPAPVIVGHDLDGNLRHVWAPYKYVSVCACYRDARS